MSKCYVRHMFLWVAENKQPEGLYRGHPHPELHLLGADVAHGVLESHGRTEVHPICLWWHILEQLLLSSSLQGRPHVKHIAVIRLGIDQGVNDCDWHFLIQEQAQLATRQIKQRTSWPLMKNPCFHGILKPKVRLAWDEVKPLPPHLAHLPAPLTLLSI